MATPVTGKPVAGKPVAGKPVAGTGVSNGIRVSVAIVVAIILGIFILLWDGNFIIRAGSGIPHFIGSFVFLPLIAVALIFGGDCLIQYLSCGNIQWGIQAQRAAVVPIPFWAMSLVLYFVPILRWPIEGLAQRATPSTRNGLSSGFYYFWTGLYTQSLLISLSQFC